MVATWDVRWVHVTYMPRVGDLWTSRAQLRRLKRLSRDVAHLRWMLWVWKCLVRVRDCEQETGAP